MNGMIFKNELCQKVLDGTKTQTRRLVKDDDFVVDWPMVCVFRKYKSGNGSRLAFRENQTYAVQPGRGKHAVGRIGIVRIRKQALNAITHDDARAEGVGRSIAAFAELWDSIHPKGKRWKDNPEVWVLDFEMASQ